MNTTIDFYSDNSTEYFNSTVIANMKRQYDDFLDGIPKMGLLMDLGCGSGRDSKYFISRNYRVVSIDGSKSMARIASKFTSQDVLIMDFKEVLFSNMFDGIWACASLLHISKDEFISVMNNLLLSLKPKGKMYLSLKNGTGTSIENGRFYQYYLDEEVKQIVDETNGFRLIKSYSSKSSINQSETRNWNNYFLIKE